MAKVSFSYPVKDICGKIGKDAEVGFFHRGDQTFTVKYGKRKAPLTENEQNWRNTFKQALAATRTRMQDPEKMLADQQAFAAQSKYKTLYQYVLNAELEKMK